MRGGENNGRHERDTGDSPDQHRQPQAGIAPAEEDQLAQSVQAVSPQGVPLGAAGIRTDAAGCDRGSDHICAAGGTDLIWREVKTEMKSMVFVFTYTRGPVVRKLSLHYDLYGGDNELEIYKRAISDAYDLRESDEEIISSIRRF